MNIKLLLWSFLLTAYFLILSFNLTALPLYLDEGLYIFWAYLFSVDPSYAYISMQDGKTPLFIWLAAWLNPLFNNFLLTGRFISVIGSTVSLVCSLIIGSKILGKKSAYFILILFTLTPFNILISRLAFVDSLLIAFGSLNILFLFLSKESAVRFSIHKTIIYAILSGIFLGLAFLTKTTAKIFLYAELIILIYWGLELLKHSKFKAVLLLTISFVISVFIYFEIMGYLKFGALKHWEMIANKEAILIFSPPDLFKKFFIEKDFSTHLKNIPITLEYLLYYFGPILLFFITGVILILKQRKYIWILLLFLTLIAGVFLSAKIPASRYLAIIIPEVVMISSIGLYWMWQKKSKALKTVSVILLVISAFLSQQLILNPLNAYYSSDDRANFIDYNLNALGLRESVNYLEPKRNTSAVAVTGIWGVAEGSLVSFKEKGIDTYPTDKVVNSVAKEEKPCEENFTELEGKCWKIDFGELATSPKEKYVYFISEHIDIATLKKLVNLEIVKDFQRPATNLHTYLIKLNEPSFPDN